jgi:HTH-type transcriptional regulator/antitoxin HigA
MSVDTIVDRKEYAGLLRKILPRVIHTEEENERCLTVLEALDGRDDLSVEEERMAELLTLLIENYEERTYQLPKASPVDVVRHLMEANDLRQAQMLDIFGSPSVVSEVLSGKRELSKAHIERLCSRFHVSPELFLSIEH